MAPSDASIRADDPPETLGVPGRRAPDARSARGRDVDRGSHLPAPSGCGDPRRAGDPVGGHVDVHRGRPALVRPAVGRAGRPRPRSSRSPAGRGWRCSEAASSRSSSAACSRSVVDATSGSGDRRGWRWPRSSSAHRPSPCDRSSEGWRSSPRPCSSCLTVARIPRACGSCRSSSRPGPTSTAASSSGRWSSAWHGWRTSTTGSRGHTATLVVAVVSVAAACLTPFGPTVWGYAVGLSTNPSVTARITEWQATSLRDIAGTPVLRLGAGGRRAHRQTRPRRPVAEPRVAGGLRRDRGLCRPRHRLVGTGGRAAGRRCRGGGRGGDRSDGCRRGGHLERSSRAARSPPGAAAQSRRGRDRRRGRHRRAPIVAASRSRDRRTCGRPARRAAADHGRVARAGSAWSPPVQPAALGLVVRVRGAGHPGRHRLPDRALPGTGLGRLCRRCRRAPGLVGDPRPLGRHGRHRRRRGRRPCQRDSGAPVGRGPTATRMAPSSPHRRDRARRIRSGRPGAHRPSRPRRGAARRRG